MLDLSHIFTIETLEKTDHEMMPVMSDPLDPLPRLDPSAHDREDLVAIRQIDSLLRIETRLIPSCELCEQVLPLISHLSFGDIQFQGRR